MPYFGGICVKCPEGCKKCTNSYECTDCENRYEMLDKKCVENVTQVIKNRVKGCNEVNNGNCKNCITGLKLEGYKCVADTNINSEKIKNLEDKKTIANALIEEKIEKNSNFNKKIMKMYKYLQETKLNIIGDYAFKHYYTFGPIRFRPSFTIEYKIENRKPQSRRGLDGESIELKCSPEDSSKSEGEGVIHNICTSEKTVKPEDVFCDGCTIKAENPNNGLIISEGDLKNDNELKNELLSEKEIDSLVKNMTENLFKIDEYTKSYLKFSNKNDDVKKGLIITFLVTYIKNSARNRILDDGAIEVADGSYAIEEEVKESEKKVPVKYNEPKDISKIDVNNLIDIEMIAPGGNFKEFNGLDNKKKLEILTKESEDSFNTTPNKSSSGLSGGAIAAIVIVCCVVIIAIIAIAIAIKTKAIGGVKPAYETANNFSTTSGKTVQPEQVYI